MSNKKKVERYIYPAIFTYEDGCEIAVEFPDLDTATSGEDENDAGTDHGIVGLHRRSTGRCRYLRTLPEVRGRGCFCPSAGLRQCPLEGRQRGGRRRRILRNL